MQSDRQIPEAALVAQVAETIAGDVFNQNVDLYRSDSVRYADGGLTEGTYVHDGDVCVEWFFRDNLAEIVRQAKERYSVLSKQKYGR